KKPACRTVEFRIRPCKAGTGAARHPPKARGIRGTQRRSLDQTAAVVIERIAVAERLSGDRKGGSAGLLDPGVEVKVERVSRMSHQADHRLELGDGRQNTVRFDHYKSDIPWRPTP